MSQLCNYRPISFLLVASKILEGVVWDQVYMGIWAPITCSQHGNQGFIDPGHSMTTTLLHVANEWYYSLDQGLLIGGVFLDISKAFDTVDQKLIHRLHNFGLESVVHIICQGHTASHYYQLWAFRRFTSDVRCPTRLSPWPWQVYTAIMPGLCLQIAFPSSDMFWV